MFSFVIHRIFSTPACETYAALLCVFAVVFWTEYRAGNAGHYLSGAFRLEALYMLLMVGGIYGLAQQPLMSMLRPAIHHQANIHFHTLRHAPSMLRLALFLLAIDFCRYWWHRAMHAVPALWVFHCVHHAAKRLTVLTNYRMHLVEFLFDSILVMIPAYFFGGQAVFWPVLIVLTALTAFAHSGFDLQYGWFGNILVSPRFHGIHHSDKPTHFNANFGAILAIWDKLFGTACLDPMPLSYGLEDMQVPDSLIGQFFYPFLWLAGRAGRIPDAERA